MPLLNAATLQPTVSLGPPHNCRVKTGVEEITSGGFDLGSPHWSRRRPRNRNVNVAPSASRRGRVCFAESFEAHRCSQMTLAVMLLSPPSLFFLQGKKYQPSPQPLTSSLHKLVKFSSSFVETVFTHPMNLILLLSFL